MYWYSCGVVAILQQIVQASLLWQLVDKVLTDLLAELYQLHLSWHVSHCPHALAQVLTSDEAIFVFVKLLEGLTQLWKSGRMFYEIMESIKY